MSTMDPDKQKNMKDELLGQLHEQYAVNNNANLSTIITLVVTLIAVIGYFGYVYVHTGVQFSENFGCLIAEKVGDVHVYYIDALLLVYLASVGILGILARLCIYQGVAQRKEQFIVDAIRNEYIDEGSRLKIFPLHYNPYKKRGLEIVQGLYGELVKIFKGVFWMLSIGVSLKIFSNIYINYSLHLSSLSGIGLAEVIVCILFVLLYCKSCVCYHKQQEHAYSERKNEYLGTFMKNTFERTICPQCKISFCCFHNQRYKKNNKLKTIKQ